MKLSTFLTTLRPCITAGLVAIASLAAMPAFANHSSQPASVALVGNLQSELGCPGDWQPECAATELFDNGTIWVASNGAPQLYLTGSHSGYRALRGQHFESIGDDRYRLVTMLGAAADDPENGLLPRQLFITDTSGERRSCGSATDAGETAVLDRAIRLAEGHAGIYLNLDKPGLFQFDFDMRRKGSDPF